MINLTVGTKLTVGFIKPEALRYWDEAFYLDMDEGLYIYKILDEWCLLLRYRDNLSRTTSTFKVGEPKSWWLSKEDLLERIERGQIVIVKPIIMSTRLELL